MNCLFTETTTWQPEWMISTSGLFSWVSLKRRPEGITENSVARMRPCWWFFWLFGPHASPPREHKSLCWTLSYFGEKKPGQYCKSCSCPLPTSHPHQPERRLCAVVSMSDYLLPRTQTVSGMKRWCWHSSPDTHTHTHAHTYTHTMSQLDIRACWYCN